MDQGRILELSNAGFNEVNGKYIEIEKNMFEMARSDNKRVYRIELETNTPFGNSAWTINRIDGFNNICIYANTSTELDNKIKVDKSWYAVVGDEPFPSINVIQLKGNPTKDAATKFKEIQIEKRKKWKKKSILYYWSRNQSNWIKGVVLEAKNDFIYIEQQHKYIKKKKTYVNDDQKDQKDDNDNVNIKYEKFRIRRDSELLQPDIDDDFYKRKLKKKQNVNVWSRNQLKWINGVISGVVNNFVCVQCGVETRWIQKNSVLIQAY